jgi:hypothetical protein
VHSKMAGVLLLFASMTLGHEPHGDPFPSEAPLIPVDLDSHSFRLTDKHGRQVLDPTR